MKKILLLLLVIINNISLSAQSFNGFALYNSQGSNTTYLIDENQNIAHSWNLNTECNYTVLLKDNGNLIRGTKYNNNILGGAAEGGRVQEIAPDGSIVWDYIYSDANHLSHHDITLIGDNVLLTAWEVKTISELEAYGYNNATSNKWPTHFIELQNENTMIAKKIKVIPLEVVLRNIAYGSLCRQTTINPGTIFAKPLIDIYLKNDELNDPLITKDRIELMKILSSNDLDLLIDLTLKINSILKSFFKKIRIQLVDFKLEFGYDCKNKIVLGDEISPDNCRLWDINKENDTIVSLDKDRFRNDLGDLIEAYSEINTRIENFIKFPKKIC